MEDDMNQQILKELKKLNRISIWTSIIFALILIIFISVSLIYRVKVNKKTNYDIPIWTQINDARNRADNEEEIRLVKTLIDKNPNDYYLNVYLGSAYMFKRDLQNAEKHYARGYELFPLKEYEEYLKAVRKLIEQQKNELKPNK